MSILGTGQRRHIVLSSSWSGSIRREQHIVTPQVPPPYKRLTVSIMLSASSLEQPTIVFTPSTPVMSPTFPDYEIEALAQADPYPVDEVDCEKRSRRASFYRSSSTPASPVASPPRQPVILHRPQSTSPFGSRWSFARARRSVMESCWKSEDSARAIASAVSDGLGIVEKPTLVSRVASESWVGTRRAWVDTEDEEDFSEPDSTPSTPVFPHRVAVSSASPQHGSRCITLISTLVIALAFAALAFTTFFHPTFGNKISKLPESANSPAENGRWAHGFFHMDGLFGHSDEDGLVGISSADRLAAASGDYSRELRKRGAVAAAEHYLSDPTALSSAQPTNNPDTPQAPVDMQKRRPWRPWYQSSSLDIDEEERIALQHRRTVEDAARRMNQRREALSKRFGSQLRR
jgi:hypothetical protein